MLKLTPATEHRSVPLGWQEAAWTLTEGCLSLLHYNKTEGQLSVLRTIVCNKLLWRQQGRQIWLCVNGFSLWSQEICLVSLKCPGEEGHLQVSAESMSSVSKHRVSVSAMIVEGWQASQCDVDCATRLHSWIYEVSSGETTLWRAVLGRGRCPALAERLLFSDGSVSACGVLASPTSSRRNLNLDRKSCQTTYQPGRDGEVE